MENTDSVGMSETLQQQYVVVKQQTTQSHVMQYGDQSFVQLPIGAFLANQRQAIEAARFSGHRTPKSTDVRSRDIPMHSVRTTRCPACLALAFPGLAQLLRLHSSRCHTFWRITTS